MIEIDGSCGEGGGQVLRTATALSAVLQKPCHVFNIRKNRPKPGLATQHLVGIESLARLCNGKLEGDFLSSEEIRFWPGEITSQNLKVEIETAGSITLVLQALLIPSLFPSLRSGQVLPIKIKFQGGATDTFFSPPIDYFRFVFLPMLKKIIGSLPNPKGGEIKINILKRGFYPEGGAEVEVEVTPLEIFQTPHQPPHQILVGDGTGPVQHRASLWCWEKEKTLSLENRGELKRILVISGASDSLKEKKVAERQISGARETPLFYKKAKLPIETKIEYYDSFSTGSQITIIGEFEESILGASALGKIGKSSEEVGKEAAMEFLRETKELVFVDKHFSDQILPYIALLTKSAKITTSGITQHTKTNIWVIEKFTQYRDKVSGSGFINGKFGIKENIISWKS